MMLFGHLGLTGFVSQKFSSDNTIGWRELAKMAFCAMLPDLIDKPLYTLGLAPVNSSRIWGHTLILSLMFCLFCWRFWSSLWPWALATPAHLVLDRMWVHPRTLFWPVLGNRLEATIPFGLDHFQFPDFLRWRWEQEPFPVIFDLVAEVAGVVLFMLLLKKMGVIQKFRGRYGQIKSLEKGSRM